MGQTLLLADPLVGRPLVDRQTPVKTLPFLAVGNYERNDHLKAQVSQTAIIL